MLAAWSVSLLSPAFSPFLLVPTRKEAWSGLAAALTLQELYDQAYEAAAKGLPDLFPASEAAKDPKSAFLAWSVSKVILDPYEIDEESRNIRLYLTIASLRAGARSTTSEQAGGAPIDGPASKNR